MVEYTVTAKASLRGGSKHCAPSTHVTIEATGVSSEELENTKKLIKEFSQEETQELYELLKPYATRETMRLMR